MRRTFAWVVILLAALGWAAWRQVHGLWSQRDAFIAERLRAKLDELAPEWRVEFETVELQDGARVRLTGLQAGPRERGDVLIELPELVAQLDPDLLADRLQVLITRVDVTGAVVHLNRDAAGRWNCQDLPPISSGGVPGPEIRIRDGSIQVHLEAGPDLPDAQFELSQITADAVPRAFRDYEIKGASEVDAAGALTFDGAFNYTTLAWTLSGRCAELKSPERLLQMAASFSPEARRQLACLPMHSPGGAVADAVADGGRGVEVRPAAQSRVEAGPTQRCCIAALGVSARLDLAFHLAGGADPGDVQYQVGARVRDGEINNPALPVPLHDLSGELFLDNQQIIVRSLQAANGESRLFVDGHLRRDSAAPQKRFVIRAQNLRFGREIRDELWGGLLRVYDAMQPAGQFNIDLAAETNAAGRWDVTLHQFEAQDCSVLLAAFPYPVQQVSGRIWQEGERFHVDFTGWAGSRPVTVRGEFRDPGPNLQTNLQVEVENVPLDGALRRAFATPALAQVHRTLERLQFSGFADARARVVKRGVPGEPVKVAIDASFREAALSFEGFPYLVQGLSGRITHDPLAEDAALRNLWQFTDLAGWHRDAKLSGYGAVAVKGPQAVLDLTLSAVDVPIDSELEHACLTASPMLRELFDSIGRVGRVDLDAIRVLWAPGVQPVISLPSIQVKDGVVRLKYWPYTWERVNGKLAWDRHRLTIANLDGWYGGETYLQIDNGGDPEAAVLEIPPEGDLAWRLHLEQVRIRKLVPDSVFRRSLIPSGVATIVETLDPRGPLDLDIGLDVKRASGPDGLVTAAWRLDSVLKNNSFKAGLELSDVTGQVHINRGVWDGSRSYVDGYFELESATALDVPLQSISGPFLVDGDDVYVGDPWPEDRTRPAYDPAVNPFAAREVQEVQADVYRGRLGLSLLAKLSTLDPEQTTYRAMLYVRNVHLEDWAADNGYTRDRLRGPINGQVDFVGQGSSDRTLRGQGWVQISPAQLYELPVLNRVLASFDVGPPSRTAFNYAFGEFELRDGLFDFKVIDLAGDQLRLVGKGTVAYADGLNNQLAIEFGRSKFINKVPIWGQIFSAVTTNSIGLRVGGTVSEPAVQVQPKLGIVDDTLRKMLDAFNNGQRPTAPRPIPRLGQPLQRALPPGS